MRSLTDYAARLRCVHYTKGNERAVTFVTFPRCTVVSGTGTGHAVNACSIFNARKPHQRAYTGWGMVHHRSGFGLDLALIILAVLGLGLVGLVCCYGPVSCSW